MSTYKRNRRHKKHRRTRRKMRRVRKQRGGEVAEGPVYVLTNKGHWLVVSIKDNRPKLVLVDVETGNFGEDVISIFNLTYDDNDHTEFNLTVDIQDKTYSLDIEEFRHGFSFEINPRVSHYKFNTNSSGYLQVNHAYGRSIVGAFGLKNFNNSNNIDFLDSVSEHDEPFRIEPVAILM